jgi:ADP-ribose pyrophosphatase
MHVDGPQPWKRLAARPGPDLVLFRARHDRLVHPRSGTEFERLVLETPDWVNVVALTPERRLVLVRQYRFGTDEVTVEIPGGIVDPGEDHRTAAQRELREESGHTATRWRYLGWVAPNPAFHDNRLHHWLAEDARPTAALAPDPGEDISVETWDLDAVRAGIQRGEISHSLVVAALARVLDLRGPEHSDAGSTQP